MTKSGFNKTRVLYRWSDEEFDSAFNELKESFMELLSQCEHLHEENKISSIEYIVKFHELIGSIKDIKDVFKKSVLKIPSVR